MIDCHVTVSVQTVWQTCPVCQGLGVVPFNPAMPTSQTTGGGGPWTCPTCHGQRVIRTIPSFAPVGSETIDLVAKDSSAGGAEKLRQEAAASAWAMLNRCTDELERAAAQAEYEIVLDRLARLTAALVAKQEAP